MLFSVSRASVRRLPDEPGDEALPVVTGCCPVQEVVFQSCPLTPASNIQSRQAVAAVSRLAGRNSVQMRTFLNPTVSRRGTFEQLPAHFPFVITRVRTPVRERQEGGLGWRSPRAGRTLEIASRHDLTWPARPSSTITHISLPACLASHFFRISSRLQFFRPPSLAHLLRHRPLLTQILPIPSTHTAFVTIHNCIDTDTTASSQPTSSKNCT